MDQFLMEVNDFCYNVHMKHDDEELGLSASNIDYSKSDGGKRDLLKKQIESELGTELSAVESKNVESATDSELQHLRDQLSSKQDSEQKRAQDEDDISNAFHTETLLEMEEGDILQADTDLTAEDLQKQQRERDTAQDDAQEEYQAQAG